MPKGETDLNISDECVCGQEQIMDEASLKWGDFEVNAKSLTLDVEELFNMFFNVYEKMKELSNDQKKDKSFE